MFHVDPSRVMPTTELLYSQMRSDDPAYDKLFGVVPTTGIEFVIFEIE